jgi:predicted nucleic acid-binding protein
MSADPAAHLGADRLCLDATPLLHFNNHGFLDSLGRLAGNPTFTPQHILDVEVRAPMKRDIRYRKNHAILTAEWLQGASLDDVEGMRRIAALKRRLGGAPLANKGEAHAIALAERYGWTLVMEDEGGRLAANDPKDGPVVPTVYMVTLLAVAAGFGQIDADEAWGIHKTIENERRRSILLPTHRDVFKAAAETFANLEGKVEPWPNVLSRGRTLDDLIILERRRR